MYKIGSFIVYKFDDKYYWIYATGVSFDTFRDILGDIEYGKL